MIPFPTLADIRDNVRAAAKTMRLRPGSVDVFGSDPASVLKSFWPLLPIFIMALFGVGILVSQVTGAPASIFQLAGFGLYLIASFLLFPIALLYLPALRDRQASILQFLTGYNWTFAWIVYLTIILSMIAGLFVGVAIVATILFGMMFYFFVIEWFLIRESLKISSGMAVGYVVAKFVLGLFLSGLLEPALGITGGLQPTPEMLEQLQGR